MRAPPGRRSAGRDPGLPARGPDVRRLGLALPPGRMPLCRRGNVLKRWHYVGVYTRELMLCVGHARIGPVPRSWWAVAEPGGALHGDSSRGQVTLDGQSVRVNAPGARIDLRLATGDPVETVSPVGARGNYIWTGKQAGVGVQGSVIVGGEQHRVEGPHGFVDESAGYHPRHTVWKWSAGIGRDAEGRRIGWNLVTGIHDSAEASERTIWIDGHPTEVGAVTFAADLSEVSFAEGGRLRFSEWAAREEHTDLWLVRSIYRQPFGTFEGDLPGGGHLTEAYGVMEDHEVWW